MRKPAIALLVLTAACGSAYQGEPVGSVSPLALEPPPVYSLLGFRETLELTTEQVEALDSIAQGVEARNTPVVDSLRAIANARSGRARGLIPIDERTRPLLERVRENNRGAALAIQELLDEEQEREVCALFDQTRRERERARRPRPQPAAADTALFVPMRGWPWCGPAAPPV